MFSLLQPVAEVLEFGLLVIDERGEVVLVSQAFVDAFGATVEQVERLTPAGLMDLAVSLVDDPPPTLAERRMFPAAKGLVFEEFELVRPSRSVLRWVARRLSEPLPHTVVVTTDVTVEVDIRAAFEKLSVTDLLTGLTNRRGAEQQLRKELARSRRYGHPLSAILLDVDRFKSINDAYGHGAGDRVLCQVARSLEEAIRSSDTACRWGGEEFLVILPETAQEGALILAERLRLSVARSPQTIGTEVTVSGGVVQFKSDEELELGLSRADAALYRAKGAGRNRIFCGETSKPTR